MYSLVLEPVVTAWRRCLVLEAQLPCCSQSSSEIDTQNKGCFIQSPVSHCGVLLKQLTVKMSSKIGSALKALMEDTKM
jgi:hypothetical protein